MKFDILPNYLILSIIEFLEPKDILKISNINKLLFNITNKHEYIIWNIIYINSKKNPKIVVSDKNNYNFQFKNYTLSISSDRFDLKEKYKIATTSHNNYLININ